MSHEYIMIGQTRPSGNKKLYFIESYLGLSLKRDEILQSFNQSNLNYKHKFVGEIELGTYNLYKSFKETAEKLGYNEYEESVYTHQSRGISNGHTIWHTN